MDDQTGTHYASENIGTALGSPSQVTPSDASGTNEHTDRTNAFGKNGYDPSAVGVRGVRLKRFEHVMATILPHVIPFYSRIPSAPTSPRGTAANGRGQHEAPNDGTGPKHCVPVDFEGNEWPFDKLPTAARVHGNLQGQIPNRKRALRKEAQLRSMLQCALALLPKSNVESSLLESEEISEPKPNAAHSSLKNPDGYGYTIVDFGGGTGHLSIPLALMMSPERVRVILVDLSEKSLLFAHEKARACGQNNGDDDRPIASLPPKELVRCQGIPNLYTWFGSVHEFSLQCLQEYPPAGTSAKPASMNMCLALHLCGEATDVALRVAGNSNAEAIIFAPCCVGKLSTQVSNPYVYQATGFNYRTMTYPQSTLVKRHFPRSRLAEGNKAYDDGQDGDWNALAKAADYSSMDEFRTGRNAARRAAKALLETDRRLFLEEQYGYTTLLTRMDPWEASPKNDIILAWKDDQSQSHLADEENFLDSPGTIASGKAISINGHIHLPDSACQADIQMTIDHLFEIQRSSEKQPSDSGFVNSALSETLNGVDWTREEEDEIRDKIESFFEQNEGTNIFVFPTRMGKRKRKLVHFVAAKLGMDHWSAGQMSSEKTVAVARLGHKRGMNLALG